MSVVYIAGAMRSGTTIAAQMLAESPSTLLVGEVRPILLQPERHHRCDCGHDRAECPYWSRVAAELGGNLGSVETGRAWGLQRLARILAWRWLRVPLPADVSAAVEFLRALASAADGLVVIDASKTPTGAALWRLAGQQVHVVHCWRDVRAVAAAQARPSAETGVPQEPVLKSWAVWLLYNGLSALLRTVSATYTRVSYRELRENPRAVADRVWRRIGLTRPAASAGRTFRSATSHLLVGNPRRAVGGSVTIEPEGPRGDDRPLPDFVIIGAQKAGSTALMRQLASHPQIYLPDGETRYFRDPWYQFEPPSVLADAVATDKPGVLRRGIKCPDLLGQPECAARLRDELGPDVSLIAVLREPVDRAISAYFWGIQWGFVPPADPETGLRRLLDGDYRTSHPRTAEILEYGLYGKHLTHYLQLYARESLLVLIDEDLRAQPERTLRTALEFLRLDPDLELPALGRQANVGVYAPARLRFLQHRHRFIMREFPGHSGRYLQPPTRPIDWMGDRVIAGIDRLVLSRIYPNTKPEISAELRGRLEEFYRPDVARLEQLLGRDLSRWTSRYSATA